MQNPVSNTKCSACRRVISAGHSDSKLWTLKEIADYRMRGFDAPGFPYGGTVTVEGWKLKERGTVETVVCEDCINSRLVDLKQAIAKETRTVKWIAIISGFIGLILTLLSIGYSSIDPAFDWSEPPYSLFAIPAGIGIVVSILAFLMYKFPDEPDDPAEELHNEFVDSEFKKQEGGNRGLINYRTLSSDVEKGAIFTGKNDWPDVFMSYGSWDIVTATWKTNSPSPGPASPYSKGSLEESVQNLGFKCPSEFIDAGEHGDVV
jgi:hypothetical protein